MPFGEKIEMYNLEPSLPSEDSSHCFVENQMNPGFKEDITFI